MESIAQPLCVKIFAKGLILRLLSMPTNLTELCWTRELYAPKALATRFTINSEFLSGLTYKQQL